jgi:phage host-nuclease inhibitor protein Gam
MSKSRIKLTEPELTRADVENILGEIALLTAREQELTASLNAEVSTIRGRYENRLVATQDLIKENSTKVQAWAQVHRDDFGGSKSLGFLHGIIGWRTGMPSLKLLAGWTWVNVLSRLKLIALSQFIRVKEEVDKEALLNGNLQPEFLQEFGMRIVQAESFYITPNLESVEPRIQHEVTATSSR